MKYISTRGKAPKVDFVEACLQGLAPDGGLYVPECYPTIKPAQKNEPFYLVASRIIGAMAGDSIAYDVIEDLCSRAFASFHHQEVTPLRDLDGKRKLLELFHGPTLAFKDVAMQFIVQLFDYILEQRQQKQTVICATSGDTGGAAAAAFARSQNVNLIVLHPHNRISSVQRKFMTCWGTDNILNLAVESDFDACQEIVKSLFEDIDFVKGLNLSGVNSINWARIAVQMTYYSFACARVKSNKPIRFVVPTGNFGDAFAGYVARKAGMLKEDTNFLCAVNQNKVLEEAIQNGELNRDKAIATNSPAMDIAVPSNFERLLFETSGRNDSFITCLYSELSSNGYSRIPSDIQNELTRSALDCESISQQQTIDEIRNTLKTTRTVVCPHTAVALSAAKRSETCRTDIILATAHPSKFPEVINAAIGSDVKVPQNQASQIQNEEEFIVIENSIQTIRDKISNTRVLSK